MKLNRYLIYRFYKSVLYALIKRFSVSVIVDQESGVSLYNAFFMISKQFRKNLLVSHSKAVAFTFTLAIFPTIIFLFTLIPFLS